MKSNVKSNTFFTDEARERALNLFPEEGAEKFDHLIRFVSIAAKYSHTPLVVPPEIDPFLHEILAARDMNGNVLETVKLSHIFSAKLGNTIRKKLVELDSPIAIETCRILKNEGFTFDSQEQFTQGACTITVLSS